MTRLALVIGILLLSTGGGMAQVKAVAKACAADIKSHCSDIKPGEGRVKACVSEHFDELTANCQIAATQAAIVVDVCRADVKANCSEVKPGRHRVEQCMKSHRAYISQACKDAISETAAGKS